MTQFTEEYGVCGTDRVVWVLGKYLQSVVDCMPVMRP